MNRTDLIATLVKEKWGWVVGGYENGISDGNLDFFPSDKSIILEVYDEVMNESYVEVRGGLLSVKKDIRFFGKDAIMKMISVYHEAHKGEINRGGY